MSSESDDFRLDALRRLRRAILATASILPAALAVSCKTRAGVLGPQEQRIDPAKPSGVALPLQALDADVGLRAVLRKRCTSRDYSVAALSRQILSEVLWAANGVNRPDDGKRTAPTAHNWQYIDIYVFDALGVYFFDAGRFSLLALSSKDMRRLTGIQPFAATAPLSLVYVSDERKMDGSLSDETRLLFGAASAGAIVQNVYLYCAEAGLVTGVRADIEVRPLHAALGLHTRQRILLAQSVGHLPG